MRIGTYNLHQYYEYNRLNTLCIIAEKIVELDLDIVGLQEIAEFEFDFSNDKATNTAKALQHILKVKYKSDYYLSLNMFKYGFQYNLEGLAILSKYPFVSEKNILVSNTTDERNYHKREIQVNTINYQGKNVKLVNGHYTWDNEIETFKQQFERLMPNLVGDDCILMGDFNNTYQDDNYYLVTNHFTDICAEQYVQKETFNYEGDLRRIDYVFTNMEFELEDHQVLFTDPMYSDHYFVTVKIKI